MHFEGKDKVFLYMLFLIPLGDNILNKENFLTVVIRIILIITVFIILIITVLIV